MHLQIDVFLRVVWALTAIMCIVASIAGYRDFRRIYPLLYERLDREGPVSIPFPLARSDPINILGICGSYTLVGCVLCFVASTLIAMALALLAVPTPLMGFARSVAEAIMGVVLLDQLLVQRVLVPLGQEYDIGVLLHAVQLYAYIVKIISGGRRAGFLALIFFWSFFLPHRCIFPASFERIDTCHVSFVALVMEEVERNRLAASKHLEMFPQNRGSLAVGKGALTDGWRKAIDAYDRSRSGVAEGREKI